MGNNRFDFDTAQKLGMLLLRTADTMEAENQKMRHNFQALGETWKDTRYEEFRDLFHSADVTIERAVMCLQDLNRALQEYAQRLHDSL